MGFDGKLVALGKGGMLGAVVGAVTAVLLAPKSGDQLQRDVNNRVQEAKLAGNTAKLQKQSELIERYRQSVRSTTALEDAKVAAQLDAAHRAASITQEMN
jgi:gas vesicle protein